MDCEDDIFGVETPDHEREDCNEPYDCHENPLFEPNDYPFHVSMEYMCRNAFKDMNAPDIAYKLRDEGFFLQGSRSKLYMFPDVVKNSDWDFTFPLDYNERSKEYRDMVRDMGFVSNAYEDASGVEMMMFNADAEYPLTDPNIKEYWKHPDCNVTLILNKNEQCFREMWNNIDPITFELFVWKKSFYNKGVPREIVYKRRTLFMMHQYASMYGLTNVKRLLDAEV